MSDAPIPTTDEQEAPAPRLLLVDDEPGLRTAVQAYLEDEGFEVTTAVDGEEGFVKNLPSFLTLFPFDSISNC